MKRLLTFLMMLLVIQGITRGQTSTVWTDTVGGNQLDYAEKMIATDTAIFFIGSSQSSDDWFSNNQGSYDWYLGKISNWNGRDTSIRITSWGTTDDDRALDMCFTSDGNIVVVGTQNVSSSNYNLSIIKFDPNGNVLWNHTIDSTASDGANAVIEHNNYLYVTGFVQHATPSPHNAVWLLKFDLDGNLIKTLSFGYDGPSQGLDLTIANDSLAVVGEYFDTNDGYSDVFLAQVDTGLNNYRLNLHGDLGADSGKKIIYHNNEFHIFSNIEDISDGYNDMAVIKTDVYGNLIEQKVYDGNLFDKLRGAIYDDNGFVLVGESQSTTLADSTLAGGTMATMIKIDGSLNIEWIEQYGGSSENYFYDITKWNNSYYTVGQTKPDASLGHGEFADIWNHHIDPPVNCLAVADFTVTDTTVCNGTALEINDNHTGSTVEWLFDAQTISLPYTPDSSGVLKQIVTDDSCIDSLSKEIVVNQPYTKDSIVEICQGEEIMIAGQLRSVAGNYSEILTDLNNCDSTTNYQLIVNPLPNINLGNNLYKCTNEIITLVAGSGFNYLWNNDSTNQTIDATTPGEYWIQVTDVNECQNSDTITIFDYPFTSRDSTSEICIGDSIFWKNDWIKSSGNYPDTLISSTGCQDSIIVLKVTTNPLPVLDLGNDITSCDSTIIDAGSGFSSYLWNNNSTEQTIKVFGSGEYWIKVTDSKSCSNSDTINITINNSYHINDTITGCDSIDVWNDGNYIYAGGLYSNTFTSINNCDSLIERFVVLNQSYFTQDTVEICQGDSIELWDDGAFYKLEGLYSKNYLLSTNCDSLVEKYVKVNQLPNVDIYDYIVDCDSTTIDAGNGFVSYLWNTDENTQLISVADSGFYWVQVTDTLNCVNYDTTYVHIDNSFEVSDTIIGCDSVDLWNDGNYIYVGGLYSKTFEASSGCDSLVNRLAIINNSYYAQDTVEICQGDTTTVHGQQFWSDSTATITFQTINGCDSVFNITSYINEVYIDTNRYYVCDAVADTTINSLITINGCDSIIVDITIPLQSYVDTTYLQVCDGIADTSITVLSTVNGCDSIITNITILWESYQETVAHTGCDSLYLGGQWWYEDVIIVDSLETSNGCDSVITHDIRISSLPQAEIICEDTSFCENSSALLQANATGLKSTKDSYIYVWSNGLEGQQVEVNQPGPITVQCSDGVCYGPPSAPIELTAKPLPVIKVIEDVRICEGEIVGLNGAKNTSMDFDGRRTSNVVYQDHPTLHLGTEFTIVTAFKVTSNWSFSTFGGIFHKGQNPDFVSDEDVSLQLWNDKKLHFIIRDNTSNHLNDYYGLHSPENIQLHRWYVCAVTLGPSGMKMYLDGELVAQNSHSIIPRNSGGPLVVGAQLPKNKLYNSTYKNLALTGLVDELHYWSVELSHEEILDVTSRTLDPENEDGLQFYMSCDKINHKQVIEEANGLIGNSGTSKLSDDVPFEYEENNIYLWNNTLVGSGMDSVFTSSTVVYCQVSDTVSGCINADTINVIVESSTSSIIEGVMKYDNDYILPEGKVKLYKKEGNSFRFQEFYQLGNDGYFIFDDLDPFGEYILKGFKTNANTYNNIRNTYFLGSKTWQGAYVISPMCQENYLEFYMLDKNDDGSGVVKGYITTNSSGKKSGSTYKSTSKSGSGLAGIEVVLNKQVQAFGGTYDRIDYVTETDENGYYEIYGVEQGEYEVDVSSPENENVTMVDSVTVEITETDTVVEVDLNVDTTGTSVIVEPIESISQLKVYPNPSNENINIAYSLQQNSVATIEVYSSLGTKVNSISLPKQPMGDYVQNLNINQKGLFFVVLKTNYGQFKEKIIIN